MLQILLQMNCLHPLHITSYRSNGCDSVFRILSKSNNHFFHILLLLFKYLFQNLLNFFLVFMIVLCILLKAINGTKIAEPIISYLCSLIVKNHSELQQCSKQLWMLQHQAVGILICRYKAVLVYTMKIHEGLEV